MTDFALDATYDDADGLWTVRLEMPNGQMYTTAPADPDVALREALAWYSPLLAVQLGADAEQTLRRSLDWRSREVRPRV